MDNLNWLSRDEIVSRLEKLGFCCYDHESIETLREALWVHDVSEEDQKLINGRMF